MSYNFFRVETVLTMPKKIFVEFRQGIVLILMAVSTESVAASDYEGIMYDSDNAVSEITLQDSNIRLSFNNNSAVEAEWKFQSIDDLSESLMMHRGENLSDEDMRDFKFVAGQLPEIGIKDSMVTYEREDRQISYHLLTKHGLVAHLTQYFNPPKDQIVYSIEQGGDFLVAGHAPVEGFGDYLSRVLIEYSQKA